MKIACECGSLLHDGADNLPHKAHLIPDREWNRFWDAIDDAVEKSGPTANEKEVACMRLRSQSFGHRRLWQCPACGRLYIEDIQGTLQCFQPASTSVPRNLLG